MRAARALRDVDVDPDHRLPADSTRTAS
jgi:hypothetical protein